MKCLECGKGELEVVQKDGRKYAQCSECGTLFTADDIRNYVPQPQAPALPSDKAPAALRVMLGLMVVALIALLSGLAILIATGGEQDAPAQETATANITRMPSRSELIKEGKLKTNGDSSTAKTANTRPDTDRSATQDDSSTDKSKAQDNFNTYNNQEQKQTTSRYVLNTSTRKFHHPSCSDVPKIASKNYAVTDEARDEVIEQGYTPCGHCEPLTIQNLQFFYIFP